MSLTGDFEWYYNDTWLGYRRDGVILPFYVDSVRQSGRHSSSDYSQEAMNALRLRGSVFNDRGNSDSITVSLNDPNLVLTTPDLGYSVVRNNLKWLTLTPVRSVKKGLNRQRLGGVSLEHTEWYSLFNPEETANPLGRISPDFAIIRDRLNYKNKIIGAVEEQRIILSPAAAYLQNILSRFTQRRIMVE